VNAPLTVANALQFYRVTLYNDEFIIVKITMIKRPTENFRCERLGRSSQLVHIFIPIKFCGVKCR